MTGGVSCKRGDWYERDYVCHQCLRLLGEHVDGVMWEAVGEDEKGVDCWLVEGGRRIAVQCKARSVGTWNASALRQERVLSYACRQLEREAGERAASYRLVTTTSAPALGRLTEKARVLSRERWAAAPLDKQEGAILAQLGDHGAGPRDRSTAQAILKRVEVEVLGWETLRQLSKDLARDLAGQDGDRLLAALRSLPWHEHLGKMLGAPDLRALLPADLSWRSTLDRSRFAERLDRQLHDFLESVRLNRRLGRLIDRPEVAGLVEAMHAVDGAATVVAHGKAGSGKSEVLACAIERATGAGTLVLPVRADGAAELDQSGLTIGRLVAFAGSETQRLLQSVVRPFREARSMGCRIVVGSRTIDATCDTQLRNLLSDGERIHWFANPWS